MPGAIAERLRRFVIALAMGVAATAHAQSDNFQAQIPASSVQELERARALRSAKNPNAAIPILQGLVARQPDYFNAQLELGLAYADQNEDLHRAVAPLEKAAALKRSHPEITDAHIFNTLGWAYMYTGQSARAEAAFKEAESHLDQLAPDVQRRLYNNLGYLYLNTGRRAQADQYLRIAADKYGSNQARVNLRTLEALKKRDAAAATK
jgi:tetratricopeptide (TPR) repeat protein